MNAVHALLTQTLTLSVSICMLRDLGGGGLILAQGTCEHEGKATPLTNIAKHHLLFYLPNSYWAPTILCKNKTLGLGLGNSGSRVSSQSTSYIRWQTYRKPMVGMGWKWSEGPWWSTWKPALPKTKGISIGIMTAVLLFSLSPSPFLRHDYQDSVCLQLDYWIEKCVYKILVVVERGKAHRTRYIYLFTCPKPLPISLYPRTVCPLLNFISNILAT